MSAFDLLTLSLSTWLIAYIVVKLNSPFDLVRRFREYAIRHSTLPDDSVKPGSVGEWISCIYCVSVSVGIVCYAIWLTPARDVLYPFAVAGGALMLHRYTGGNHV